MHVYCLWRIVNLLILNIMNKAGKQLKYNVDCNEYKLEALLFEQSKCLTSIMRSNCHYYTPASMERRVYCFSPCVSVCLCLSVCP